MTAGRNVLLLSNAYWPSIGGVENSLRHLSEEARSLGDNVQIIVSDLGVPQDIQDRLDTIIDEVRVRRYRQSPIQASPLRALNFIFSSWELFQILRCEQRIRPESIIIARFHLCAILANLAGFRRVHYLVPSIVDSQVKVESKGNDGIISSLKRRAFTTLHNVIQRAALRSCKNYIFSETMRRQCSQLACNSPENYTLTKPGVDTRRFRPGTPDERSALRRKFGIPADSPVVLFVGRFVKAKGVDLLIESISMMDENVHVVLVGGGEQEAAYRSKISGLGLSARTTFIAPTRSVEDVYRCSDVFVMSSTYEPLGQTLLEAFASGLLVSAFRRGIEINTATEELEMDRYVAYASEPTAKALATSICEQIKRLPSHNREDEAEEAARRFSWRRLYCELVLP